MFVRADNGVVFERFVDSGPQQLDFPLPITPGFTYVVTTYGEAGMRLYVNGTLVVQGADGRQMSPVSELALIGAASPTEPTNFAGVIDEVAVYPTELTLKQVQIHFFVGAGD